MKALYTCGKDFWEQQVYGFSSNGLRVFHPGNFTFVVLFLSIEIIGPTATNCLLAAPSPAIKSETRISKSEPRRVALQGAAMDLYSRTGLG